MKLGMCHKVYDEKWSSGLKWGPLLFVCVPWRPVFQVFFGRKIHKIKKMSR